jgi:hypothetical protein
VLRGEVMKTIEQLEKEHREADDAWKAAVDTGGDCNTTWKAAVYAYKQWKEALEKEES